MLIYLISINIVFHIHNFRKFSFWGGDGRMFPFLVKYFDILNKNKNICYRNWDLMQFVVNNIIICLEIVSCDKFSQNEILSGWDNVICDARHIIIYLALTYIYIHFLLNKKRCKQCFVFFIFVLYSIYWLSLLGDRMVVSIICETVRTKY